jgi:predicted TIM-barrel fold metal-dependent hydrolase
VEVAKMVFVQCECDPSQFHQEAEWVKEVARTEPRIRGIVAVGAAGERRGGGT